MTGTNAGPDDATPPGPDDGQRPAGPEPRTAPRAGDDADDGDDRGRGEQGEDGERDRAPAAPPTRWRRLRASGRPRTAALWLGGLAGTAAVAWVTAVSTGLADRLLADDPPPACPGEACDGRNPQTAGCGDDAFSYIPQEDNPVALQIRHNPACHAVWGRIAAGEPGDVVTAEVTDGALRTAQISVNRDIFTKMAGVDNDAFTVTVCATPTTREDRSGDWQPYCISATQDAPWY
ncbi:YjfA family protein [Streptomyces sp. XM4011]|uniref:DUF2690 domain-containing protein n=1 Tax=Streptomyces sp. XM4011 TaxID=2929780 RepID=UPI001FF7A4F5|nr:DUF2690 domain-containing protein [Streptomyces sp. XM4011]MCK1817975.1 YjfA family protein [Streptomyces sp. XM4011]